MTDTEQLEAKPGEPEIRAFLIADVRGYTRFAQDHGDEAAARLAARFADITRQGVTAAGGTLLELRGDEALAVFRSSRGAIWAAMDLQSRFVAATEEDPSLPLRVGIGLDAGEAVAVEGGYRGGALNLAARLCSRAGPGQILASAGIVHLAGLVPGIRLVATKDLRLKGMDAAVRAFHVFPEGEDPAERLAAIPPPPAPAGVPATRHAARRRAGILVGLLLATAGLVAVVLLRPSARTGAAPKTTASVSSPPASPHAIIPAGVLRVEVPSGKVGPAIRVDQPERVLIGEGSVWVESSGTLFKINPALNTVVAQIPGVFYVAAGAGRIWGRGADGPLRFVDARTNQVHQIPGTHSVGVGDTAFGEGSIWVANLLDSTITEIDPLTYRKVQTISVDPGPAGACRGCTVISAGAGAVWFENTEGSLSRLDAKTLKVRVIPVPRVTSLVATNDSVWLLGGDGTLTQLSADGNTVLKSLALGEGANSLAIGEGFVWVGNASSRTVTPIDEASHEEGKPIPLPVTPVSLAEGEGSLWVSNP